ncbi:MAG: AraC family transcriptional regulator [Phenylobacterium sp.]|nr:MAG: AraC family transcriptional regulator [Phenylobacterium sp.]
MAISFRPGEFYGALARASTGGAFDIRALAASGREDDVEVHTHDDAHFVLVLSGVYISTARGAPAFAPAPFLLFNPPGTTHRDRFVDGVGAFMAVSLSASAFAALQRLEPLSEVAVPLGHAAAVARAFRIAREVRGAGLDAAILEASAWELVAATRDEPAPRHAPAWAHLAYEAVMDEAADAGLSVAAIAAAAGVHPVHLARVFRQAWGCSPGDLLRWRRAERASELLVRSRLPAAEIAAAVGFVDQSHMTRAFRALYRLTPGAWRRAHDVAPIQDAAVQAA